MLPRNFDWVWGIGDMTEVKVPLHNSQYQISKNYLRYYMVITLRELKYLFVSIESYGIFCQPQIVVQDSEPRFANHT
jgi:hypothetical protein